MKPQHHNVIDLPEESMGSYSYFPEAFTSISTGHLEFHNIFVVTLWKKRQENHMLIGAPSSTTLASTELR